MYTVYSMMHWWWSQLAKWHFRYYYKDNDIYRISLTSWKYRQCKCHGGARGINVPHVFLKDTFPRNPKRADFYVVSNVNIYITRSHSGEKTLPLESLIISWLGFLRMFIWDIVICNLGGHEKWLQKLRYSNENECTFSQ